MQNTTAYKPEKHVLTASLYSAVFYPVYDVLTFHPQKLGPHSPLTCYLALRALSRTLSLLALSDAHHVKWRFCVCRRYSNQSILGKAVCFCLVFATVIGQLSRVRLSLPKECQPLS